MFPLPVNDVSSVKTPGSSDTLKRVDESFIQLAPRDNFYQSVSFFPMPFALITTINERGTTSIGPHSLVFPFDISESHSMMLVSRASSNTATNLRRTGRCALNFIEFDDEWLKTVVALGYPGQTPEDKMKDIPFKLVDSPNEIFRKDPDYPLIMKDAFQVFECITDGTFEYKPHREAAPPLVEGFFALQVKNVLLKESIKKKLDNRREFPDMPLSYGFRGGSDFWFTRHSQPFHIPIPRQKGSEHSRIYYLANKVDPQVRFTEDACKKLTSVPQVFLEVVIGGLITEAKTRQIAMIDTEFVDDVEAKRQA
jgi:flavin reductase (DIM6/NTAB) family NADH-FMN oxidoreductase RutF